MVYFWNIREKINRVKFEKIIIVSGFWLFGRYILSIEYIEFEILRENF